MESKKSRLLLSVADRKGMVSYKAVSALLEPFLEEVLLLVDTSFSAIEKEYNLKPFVVKFEVTSTKDLVYGEVYQVETRVELSDKGLIFHQKITEDDITVVTATTFVVLRNHMGRSVEIPHTLCQQLS